jgi:beta-glucanase (GH16 family)
MKTDFTSRLTIPATRRPVLILVIPWPWSDEFNGNIVNSANWSFESGNNNGWGNSELENYTNRPQNAFVSQGNLIIEAREEYYQGNNYTSARMITKGKQVFTFGRIDIRAKLPKGKGIWPALWLLGSNIDAVGWPACGEIDMMELLGQEPNKMYGTLHWGADFASHASKGSNYTLNSGSFDEEFHVYSMVWKQDSIKMFVDDIAFFSGGKTDVAGDYPFNKDFFFIFNIAVGGNFPGNPDGTTSFPQRMVIDYIRVFQ